MQSQLPEDDEQSASPDQATYNPHSYSRSLNANANDIVAVLKNRETVAKRNKHIISNRYNNLDELQSGGSQTLVGKYGVHAPSDSAKDNAFTLYDEVVPGFLTKMFYTSQFK